jgi:hypothetical protein
MSLQICTVHTLVMGYLELSFLEAQVHHISLFFVSSAVSSISCSGTAPMDNTK